MKYKIERVLSILLVSTLLLFFSCSDEPVSPQKYGTISGRVLDVSDDSPIEGVSITTTPATVSVTTDKTGAYIIEQVKSGSHTVRASKQGYKNAFMSVTVYEGIITTADIKLLIAPSVNHPPNKPSNSFPLNGATAQGMSLLLSWSASDPDESDSLFYDIRFGSAESLPLSHMVTDHNDTTWFVDNLLFETTYFWQVIVKDASGASVNGDVWSFRTRVFPDNCIVFASIRNGKYDIYSASVNGEDIAQLTYDPAKDWWPRFNPDGDRIAFSSTRSIAQHIYVMNTNGSSLRKVTNIPIAGYNNYGIGFCWSHDGYSLYYSHYETLYRIEADGSNLTVIAEAPEGMHFRECAVSPISNKIAVVVQGSSFYSNALYIMNLDGSDMEVLVEDLPGALGHPDFSVDGETLVYYYDVSEFEYTDERLLDSHIFTINTDGTDNTDLSSNKPSGTNDIDPEWSPTGDRILFVNVPNDGSLPPDVYIMDYTIQEGTTRNRQLIISGGEMPDWK